MNNIELNKYNEEYVPGGREYPPVLKFVRNAIPIEVINILDIEFTMMRDCMKTLGMTEGFNDVSVPESFSWYSPLCFEALGFYIKPLIEKEVGEELHQTYSYARIYMNGSELTRHTDRKSSQLSASCCIRKEDDLYWPLCFKTKDGVKEFDMNPGDLVISSGTKIPHWRTKYTGSEHVQAFLQYVYADGKYQNLKYDTRPCLAAGFENTKQFIKDEVERRKHHPVVR
jgi:hypothetical protein